MFDYDWFHGASYRRQCEEGRDRCVAKHFPDLAAEERETSSDFKQFSEELLVRTLVYLRDGFSYEIKELADVDSKSHLVFECEPVDHQYKVGAFVVTLPFEEIVRVEVFAVHPSTKPADFPQITGFRGAPESTDQSTPEGPPVDQ